jgi:predicted TIM-barrel fold metal-dependent hydrolase
MQTETTGVATAAVERPLTRICTDSHNMVVPGDLIPYLPQRWQRYMDLIGLRNTVVEGLVAGAHPLASRTDAWGPNGELPGADVEHFCRQLLDEHDIDLTILNSTLMQAQKYMGPGSPRPLTAALMTAGNRFMQEHWLDRDPRLRGAICVPMEDPQATVEEIERAGADERFVQVLLPFRTAEPLGSQRYWPMFEAAEAHGLPIALHPAAQHVVTGAGWQSFYYEHHTALPSALFAQMASLVCEGTFDRFPRLQILFQEGGWAWVPPFVWRFDGAWDLLGAEVEHLERAPSEYIRDHFWFTTQPIEEPERPGQFLEVWEQFERVGLGDKLMFSSDYPHWDFDAPDMAIPRALPAEVRRAIFVDNAVKCYSRLNGGAR